MPRPVLRTVVLRAVRDYGDHRGTQAVPLRDLMEGLLAAVDPAKAVRAWHRNWGDRGGKLPSLEAMIRRGARHLVNQCLFFARKAGQLDYQNHGRIDDNVLALTPKGREDLRRYEQSEERRRTKSTKEKNRNEEPQ